MDIFLLSKYVLGRVLLKNNIRPRLPPNRQPRSSRREWHKER